jgi:hypothetical protein
MVKPKKVVRKRRPSGWKYKNKINKEALPEGVSQQGEKLEQKIDKAIEATPDSGFIAGSENHEKIVEKYKEFQEDFNKKAEDYAVALADSLTSNIATRKNFGFPRAYCVAGFLNSDRKTMIDHPELTDFQLPITTFSAAGASKQMANVFGEDGFSNNLHETLAAEIAKNPTVPQVFSVQRSSKLSKSGLHYITVAPTIDKQGQIVRDENGAVKYSVYSFNKNSITDFDTNEKLKTSGHCFNVTQMAYVKEQERFYYNTMVPLAHKLQLNEIIDKTVNLSDSTINNKKIPITPIMQKKQNVR